MTRRIHIVGAPRSGTTLLQTMMRVSFDIDGVTTDERRLWRLMPKGERILLTKSPGDENLAATLLPLDPDLYIVCMLRDPRDVVVSRHSSAPDRYWTNLRVWRESLAWIERARAHRRFCVVHYEDLVRTPDDVQRLLAAFMPFLTTLKPFSRFHESATMSEADVRAMGTLRPADPASVGVWRQHLPRLAGQVAIHGAIDQDLIEARYETNSDWRKALDGVTPDLTPGATPEAISFGKRFRRAFRRYLHASKYLLRRYVTR